MNPTEQKAQPFTAGPWQAAATQSKYGSWAVFTEQGSYNIFDATAPGINSKANAILAAAAPELLEACKIALDGNSALDKLAEKTLRDAVRKAAR
jgi:hypothetical protein